jgi:XapX domain-containing protein
MRPYFESLVLGVVVGLIYGFVKVRSPAPPAIALLGLLGMLAGEQVYRSPNRIYSKAASN